MFFKQSDIMAFFHCFGINQRKYCRKSKYLQGAIQKLFGQDFDHFSLPTYPKVDIFTLNVDKKKHFLTAYPPRLVHAVFE